MLRRLQEILRQKCTFQAMNGAIETGIGQHEHGFVRMVKEDGNAI